MVINNEETIKLTKYSTFGGCSCKLNPLNLIDLLDGVNIENYNFNINHNNSNQMEDASLIFLNEENALIHTNDFLSPVVDDPYTFGQIASVSSLSDIYAMGGKPIMAIGILGWPEQVLDIKFAKEILKGSQNICNKIGIHLGGGHTINNFEPFFGLAVVGQIQKNNIKKNSAKAGDLLYITKPLGIGILITALKKGIIKKEDLKINESIMLHLNKIGYHWGKLNYVNGITDISGYGFIGHLAEMVYNSKTSAVIQYDNVPVIPSSINYIEKGSIANNTQNNWEYAKKLVHINTIEEAKKTILSDPQTSGGLIVAVSENMKDEFERKSKELGTQYWQVGYFLHDHEEKPSISIKI